ncbi:MAG: hypothetical protein EOO46_18330 [Flavobacterium sp.]|nr:MAG: hypothetical protein EOO46_18330 [Flavobacterium sp.]
MTCFLAFNFRYDNLGYFIAVVFVFLSPIVPNTFTVYLDSFLIRRYYFFGLFRRTWYFEKGQKIKISSYGSDFGQNGEVPGYDSNHMGRGLGCLFSIFSVFLPSKIVRKEFKVEKLDIIDISIDTGYIVLDREEFSYLDKFTQ